MHLPLFPPTHSGKWLRVSCTVVSIVEDGQDDFLVACVAAEACLRTGLVLFPHVPPEQSGSGLTSWSLPLDEAKLPRRMVQV